MGDYGGQSATELDSHANMAVAGANVSIISKSGLIATVTPFSPDLPAMDDVEIGDVAMVWEDPRTGIPYILVMRNALLIPTMDHNLIPPFLIREAGLFLDETPKYHASLPTVSNHSIIDSDTGMHIHLDLNGIFSYFLTRKLTLDEMESWDQYPVVFLTPDADRWDPNSANYSAQERSMLDADGYIIDRMPCRRMILDDDEVDISALYVEPPTRDQFNAVICAVIAEDSLQGSCDDGDPPLYGEDDVCLNPDLFSRRILERAEQSVISTVVGTSTVNQDGCEMFVERIFLEGDPHIMIGAATAGKSRGVTPEHLSKVWKISHEDAARTIDSTTQYIHRDPGTHLSRNYGTDDRAIRYKHLKDTFFTDTMYATKKAKSTRGNTCAQVFVSDKMFCKVYPMATQSDYLSALKRFAKDVGVPEALVCDSHPSQKAREVKKYLTSIGTTLKILEAETQHANRAELLVGMFKESTRKDMSESNSPIVLWDYCMERRATIYNCTSKKLFQLNGTNPYTATLGDQADISNLCQFGWYEWVKYFDTTASYPHQKECLGRCLGPAENEGNAMTNWVLTIKGTVIPRRTIRPLTPGELAVTNIAEVEKRAQFTAAIRSKLGNSLTLPDSKTSFPTLKDEFELDLYEDDEFTPVEIPPAEIIDATGKPIYMQSLTDGLINAEVLLPIGDSRAMATVISAALDDSGMLIGEHNDNPLLNTLKYMCEFPDGTVKEYSANVIATNLFAESDSNGHSSLFMYKIIDHKSSGEAVKLCDKYITSKNGTRRIRQTTAGWDFLVEWTGGTRQWMPLKILKESNPVQVAEYVMARNLSEEAAFAWWVHYVLRKRDVIVSAVKSRVARTTHKYGIELPRPGKDTIENARKLDLKNGNTLYMTALAKEMGNNAIAFEIKNHGEKAPPGYFKATGHIIWDVKMDFTRKARWVKDGHKTPDSDQTNYSGVVSRESIRIALTYAALLGLPVCGADIQNAYLQAPSSEKHYIICGPEFGIENEGKVAIIVRALYGGKVAGRDFWHHLRDSMRRLGFTSSKADPDVWFRSAKRASGEEYYEYVLLYVDDVIVISEHAEKVIRDEIGQEWTLKEESIGPPSKYLGGMLRLVTLANGVQAWAFGSCQYVHAAVRNVMDHLRKKGDCLPTRVQTPLSCKYRPEIDITPELQGDDAAYYHSLIGVLRWIVELGRVDIDVEVSMMSSHLALPREGHLRELYHIFAYLKSHANTEMVFDPTPVPFDMSLFERADWSFSPYDGEMLKEELPANMPRPLGTSMTMRVFVDSDHAGDLITRRSRTGFIVFLNGAPIYWSSKRQNSCETSTFGSEFVAMKQATEYIRGLRYKLRMMGIRVDEPAFVFGDNQSVLANTTNPSSTLKKKSNAIAFEFVREGVARDEWRTAYINTHDNIADLLTKPLAGEKRRKFVSMILHHIYSQGSSDGKGED